MENIHEDQKVVDLLTKLKTSNGGYPSDMLAARRRTYLKQMANVGLGIGIGAGLNESMKGGGNGSAATTTVASKVLEIALITAIAIEAGTAAYLYRDKIADAIRLYFSAPTVQDVSSSSVLDSTEDAATSPTLIEAIVTPSVTPSETPSVTPSGTPSTSVAGGNNQNNNGGANTDVNANATPNPNGNSGNHYGQTPQPIRTKENSGGTGGSNNDGGGGTDTGGGGGNNGGGNNGRP